MFALCTPRATALAWLLMASTPCLADFLVAHSLEGVITRYDEVSGEPVPGWGITVDAPSFDGSVSGIAVHDGVIYASNRKTGQVLHYDLLSGAPISGGVFATLPPRPGEDPIQADPGGLVISPSGTLLVADSIQGSTVYEYNLTTGALVGSPVSGLNGVGALGYQSDGTLLSTDYTFNPIDFSVSPNAVYEGLGSPPSKLINEAASPLFGPAKMLVNSDDSFWVTDSFSSRVYKFDASGAFLNVFEVPLADDAPQLPAGFPEQSFPSGIAELPNGNLLIGTLGISSEFSQPPAAKNYGRLEVYDQSGSYVGQVAKDLSPVGDLQVVAPIPSLQGDYDRNNLVEVADYELWLRGYGMQVTPGSSADGNGDGWIDAIDYALWREGIDLIPAAPLTGVVPEPAAAMVLALVLSTLSTTRRR